MLYWLMKYVLLGPLLRAFWPTKVTGLENVPTEGGAILASNHLAVADSFFMPLHVPRRVTFPAKQEYFTEPGFKGRLKKWFFTGAGQFPIDRSGGAAAQAAIDTAVRLLREGRLLGIYPEGTRSPDGRLYKGKTGVARIALEARVPVIPVAMIGTDQVNPIGSRIFGRISWRSASASRWTSPTRDWRVIGSSNVRSPTRSCTRSWAKRAGIRRHLPRGEGTHRSREGGIAPAVPVQVGARDALGCPNREPADREAVPASRTCGRSSTVPGVRFSTTPSSSRTA